MSLPPAPCGLLLWQGKGRAGRERGLGLGSEAACMRLCLHALCLRAVTLRTRLLSTHTISTHTHTDIHTHTHAPCTCTCTFTCTHERRHFWCVLFLDLFFFYFFCAHTKASSGPVRFHTAQSVTFLFKSLCARTPLWLLARERIAHGIFFFWCFFSAKAFFCSFQLT